MRKKGILFLVVCLSTVFIAAETKAADTVAYNGKITYGSTTVGDFSVNGVQAFCIEHEKPTPPAGTGFTERVYENADIRKVLYYGWNGPAQWEGFENAAHGAVATSIVLSHYYCGTEVSRESRTFYEWLQTQPAVPGGQVSLSKGSTEAYLAEDKSQQRTENLTLQADKGNYITLTLPEGVVLHNVTKKTESGGQVKIYGGDSFYLSAPLSQQGTWSSGALMSAVREYQAVVCTTESDSLQNLGYGRYAPAAETSLRVKWVPHGIIRLQKKDMELDRNEAQGKAELEHAVYEIYNTQGVKMETLETDAEGRADSGLLPYDDYTVREMTPGKGYLLDSEQTCNLNAEQVSVSSGEQIIRGDLKGIKIGSGSHKRLADVPFEIMSETTGEKHIIVTDENGEFSTEASWAAHTRRTNEGSSAEDGIWFGAGEPDDGKGALLYDTYTITELPCETNEGYRLIPSFSVSVYRDKQVIDLGTLVDESPEVPEEEPEKIDIYTTASNQADGSKTVQADSPVTIVDKVMLSGLTPGLTYRLTGWEVRKEKEEALFVDGERVEDSLEFTADASEMEVELAFEFDAANLGGSDLVIFEELYEVTAEAEPKLAAEHKNLENKEQTVRITEGPGEKLSVKEEPEERTSAGKAVKTGDGQNLMVLTVLMILSCTAIFICGKIARKMKE